MPGKGGLGGKEAPAASAGINLGVGATGVNLARCHKIDIDLFNIQMLLNNKLFRFNLLTNDIFNFD